MFDLQNELAEISRKFLGTHGIYEYNNMKISNISIFKIINILTIYQKQKG